MAHPSLSYQKHPQTEHDIIILQGAWILHYQETLHQIQADFFRDISDQAKIIIDLAQVSSLDTMGAWMVKQMITTFTQQKCEVTLEPKNSTMVDFIHQLPSITPHASPPTHYFTWRAKIEEVGVNALKIVETTRDLFTFLGQVVLFLFSCIKSPKRLRMVPLLYHLEKDGLDSLPIVGLITFLVGVVLAYLGSVQLERFGAAILTVNLVAIAVLREIGILLAAIMIAGRSGSAFTAQIGTMKIHEEIDALKTLGMHPFELLVIPRILGLVIIMPLVTFWADVAGIMGGAFMCIISLDLSFTQFIRQFHQAASIQHFMVGMIKAPVFAFVIALVGCFEGFRVQGSADSVGKQTTRSVVEAIFLVIVLDALFAVFFSYIDY